tara:strand:- start:72 stop:233 length:162 start_codon:yes stop_codon:yes gene_type:complete
MKYTSKEFQDAWHRLIYYILRSEKYKDNTYFHQMMGGLYETLLEEEKKEKEVA